MNDNKQFKPFVEAYQARFRVGKMGTADVKMTIDPNYQGGQITCSMFFDL